MLRRKNNKGFFFVVTALFVLIYILTNLSLWSQTISLQEERYSENFRISNIDHVASQLTDEDMKEFSERAVSYALYKLNEHSIENPVIPGGVDSDYENIESAMRDLIIEGFADGSYFETGSDLQYLDNETESYTFVGFFAELNASFSYVGMELSTPEVTEFAFTQSAINEVSTSFNLTFSVDDEYGGYASIEKTVPIYFDLSLEGLIDPSISREVMDPEYGSQTVEKQIFLHPPGLDPTAGDLMYGSSSSGEGQGWFYGSVYDVDSGTAPEDEVKHRYVLMGTEEDITDEDNYLSYGAFIVIKDPDQTFSSISLRHEMKPMYVATSEPPTYTCGEEQCILFVSEYEPGNPALNNDALEPSADYYNIENFRDFVICGYYFHHDEGPSYFQKLFEDSYDYEDTEFGLATFLVWEGIEGGYPSDDNSRFDLEFFEGTEGARLRGLPGCKDRMMCSEEDSFVGQFKLSMDRMNEYLGNSDDLHYECDDSVSTEDWSTCGDVG